MTPSSNDGLRGFLGIKVTQLELEEHFLNIAKSVKKSLNIEQAKGIILGLIFFKRLNDVFHESLKDARRKRGREVVWGNFAGNDFFIPVKSRWNRLTKVHSKVGYTLNKMVRLVEENNPFLQDVLSTIDFDVKHRRGDEILRKMIDQLSLYSLGNENFSDPRILAESFTSLIDIISSCDFDKSSGIISTSLRKVLTGLVQPKEGDWLCDPVASDGSLLVSCASYGSVDLNKIYLYGQVKDPVDWAICKMNLLMHGVVNSQIEKGDILHEPKLLQAGKLLNFDVIVSNLSNEIVDDWEEMTEGDVFGQLKLGSSSVNYDTFALIQHMLTTLRTSGRMAVVLNYSFLFKGGRERAIRKKMIESDLIESILKLPSSCEDDGRVIVTFKKAKVNVGKILFVDTASILKPSEEILDDQTIRKILDVYYGFKEYKNFSVVVPLKEIIQYSYNLNIRLYIDIPIPDIEVDFLVSKSNLLQLEIQRQDLITQLKRHLNELEGYKEIAVGKLPDTWYEIQLEEVVKLEEGSVFNRLVKHGSIAVITSKYITKYGFVLWDKLNFVSDKNAKCSGHAMIRMHDILVARRGRHVGKVVFITELPYKDIRVDDDFFIIRSRNPKIVLQKYLYYVLVAPVVQNQIKKRFIGESGIDGNDFNTISIPIPPVYEQKALIKILDSFDTAIVLTTNIINESRKLRQWFLQKLVSGRIQLR